MIALKLCYESEKFGNCMGIKPLGNLIRSIRKQLLYHRFKDVVINLEKSVRGTSRIDLKRNNKQSEKRKTYHTHRKKYNPPMVADKNRTTGNLS